MQLSFCPLPLPRVSASVALASNACQFHPTKASHSTMGCQALHSNVRWMQRPQNTDIRRIALSGKLSDVCAALDELAAQERYGAWRTASC